MPDLRAPIITRLRQGTGVGWLRVAILLVLDSLMLSLAWIIADSWGTPVNSFELFWKSSQEPGFLLPIMVISLGILAASGLYGTDDKRRDYFTLIKSLTLAQIVLLIIAFLYKPGLIVSRSTFLLSWLLSIIFVCTERLLIQLAIVSLRRQGAIRQRIFLLGDPGDVEEARKLLDRTARFDVRGQAILPSESNQEFWIEILDRVRQLRVSEVFVCSWEAVRAPIFLYWELMSSGISLRVLPIGLKIPSQWSEIKMIDGLTTIRFRSPPILGSDFWTKRFVDIVAAISVLMLASPLFLAIALLIKFDSRGPIFYKQNRVGLKGRHFKVWKFRTMVIDADRLQKELEAKNEMKGGVMFKMKDDPRITRVGKFLRRYSLDELPQIINVLLGEMSLVGPRPFPLRDVEKMSEHHFIRHEVLPGITGLWQVSGRSNVVDFEDVFRLDITYIQNWSLALDFQILLQTIKVVLQKEGAY
ncbi:sugar transferase [Planktothrix sp. FACHB-1355]|uniref:Sugar transferase n=1 Tax=Aerosakkonema funiforme FACHB-1375 TaxID=2949571 RepID=A0A926VBY9_9CYAN|nr:MULTISPECIES: sugar transferase [Oscillatoriales]MBD2180971.1 sugar transferase [Aerosakkonema funiforme FACHB-1375]MBD3561667.1 sugar transferase [Planktothrix sp. FACHB-1355]